MHTDTLPALYAKWINQLLQGDIPEESLATCNNCAMVTNESPGEDVLSFHPDLKCCTYLPELANFLVGRILNDQDSVAYAGRATIEKRIQTGKAVSPLGLRTDARFQVLYDSSTGAFGRSHALRCPHLLANGLCGVWQHRNSVCSTWFCKHKRGAVGYEFWHSLRELLGVIEHTLALWCLLELDLDTDCLQHLLHPIEKRQQTVTVHDLDQNIDVASQQAIWGAWLGREAEFYSRCAQLVDPLDWNQLVAVCGSRVRAHAQLLIGKYKNLLSSEMPNRLVAGDFRLVNISPMSVNVLSYSDLDPVRMNRALYEALPFFDGSPLEEVRQKIHTEKGVSISLAIVRQLVDRKILVADSSEGSDR